MNKLEKGLYKLMKDGSDEEINEAWTKFLESYPPKKEIARVNKKYANHFIKKYVQKNKWYMIIL